MWSCLRVATLFVSVSIAVGSFDCKDKYDECPQWKENMNGNCRGEDYKYMRLNCPVTCDLCDEAQQEWEKEEAERAKNPTYEPADSDVIILDGETIDDFLQENPLVLLEFFAPWCGHCQQLAPAYRGAAKRLTKLSNEGKLPTPVVLAKFDDGAQENAHYRAADASKFNFTSYPSMYVVRDGEHEGFWGGHDEDEIVHMMTEVSNGKTQKEARISYHEIEKRKAPGFYKPGGKHESKYIQDVTEEDFVDTILRSDKVWIVEYYSDTCPICNSLAPELMKAAENVHDELPNVKFGAVNSRVFDSLQEPFGVTSYPWVTSFYQGEIVEHMAGMGGWESFANFAREKSNVYVEGKPGKADAVIPAVKKEGEEEEEEETATGQCEINDPDGSGCDDREKKFITKYKQKTKEDVDKQIERLKKMKGENPKPEAKTWIIKRMQILRQISGQMASESSDTQDEL